MVEISKNLENFENIQNLPKHWEMIHTRTETIGKRIFERFRQFANSFETLSKALFNFHESIPPPFVPQRLQALPMI